MAVEAPMGVPLDEFIRSYDEAPFELIAALHPEGIVGERILLVPPVAEHGEVIRLLSLAIILHKFDSPDFVFYLQMPYVFEDSPQWIKAVRSPDLMIYDITRFQVYQAETPDWKAKPFVLVPDLCVEVISANDSYMDVADKVARYLSDGVRLVWVFNPRQKTVDTHTQESVAHLKENDSLDGGDVLPEFTVSVAALYGQQ